MALRPRWRRRPLHGVACDEDVDAGVERGERPLPPQLHLHVDEEVPRAFHLPLQVHGAGVVVQLPRAEVVVLVALRDADDDVVPRVRRGGPDAEDLSGDDDVGLEAEVVVSDSERRVLAVQVVGAANPLTASARGRRDTEEGE